MQPHDLALIDIDVGLNKQPAAFLKTEQCIGERLAGYHRYQHSVIAGSQLRFGNWPIVIEDMSHDPRARGQREEL